MTLAGIGASNEMPSGITISSISMPPILLNSAGPAFIILAFKSSSDMAGRATSSARAADGATNAAAPESINACARSA